MARNIKDRKAGIYLLISPSGLRYIGKTTDLQRRINEHKCSENYNYKYRLALEIKEHGFDNFIVDYLYVCDYSICDNEYLNYLEEYYIDLYKTVEYGLNMKYGGNNYEITNEIKAKIGSANRGNTMPLHQKIMQSKKMKGKPSPMKGKKHSIETIEKLKDRCGEKNVRFGAKLSLEHNKKFQECKFKKIAIIDSDRNIIEKFESIKAAVEKYNVKHSSISNCLKGLSKTAGGYIWQLI